MRPDGRSFLRRRDAAAEGAEQALAAAIASFPVRPLYATLDEEDADGLSLYERAGFALNRRESTYLVPTDPARTGLERVEPPRGLVLVGSDRVDLDRLRLLDDTLRQDVPGTDGWCWEERAFVEETFSSAFDPATYLVAVHAESGDYVGITRVWIRSPLPRLGFIGVARPFRRSGIARALLASAFSVLHARGIRHVTTEVDETNVASRRLIESLGARRTGGTVELVTGL